MKFFALAALVATVAGIKITQHHPSAVSQVLLKTKAHRKGRAMAQLLAVQGEHCPTPEEKKKIEALTAEALADGEISPEEAMAGFKEMTGMDYSELPADVKAEVEAVWNAIDTNNDGSLQIAELEAVAEEAAAAYEEHCGEEW